VAGLMITAYTGPSSLHPNQRRYAVERMAALLGNTAARSGCAYGLDTAAAYTAVAVGADLELFVPFAPHNGTLVSGLARAEDVHVIHIPKWPGHAKTADQYRRRNNWMILGNSANEHGIIVPCDRLHAFVLRPTFYRSGEWMTINIAKRAGIDVILEGLPKVWS
jgi:hypothetical protein